MSVSYEIYFHGVLYTVIDHSNNVNMLKTHCGTTTRRRVVSLQRFEHFDVIPLVDRCIDHRKSLSICFLTLTVFYANCHYVPLRFFFFRESLRARKTNSFTITSFP